MTAEYCLTFSDGCGVPASKTYTNIKGTATEKRFTFRLTST